MRMSKLPRKGSNPMTPLLALTVTPPTTRNTNPSQSGTPNPPSFPEIHVYVKCDV